MEGNGEEEAPAGGNGLLVYCGSTNGVEGRGGRGAGVECKVRAAVDPVHCLPLSLTNRGKKALEEEVDPDDGSRRTSPRGLAAKGPPEEEPDCSRRVRCSEPRHHRRRRRTPLKLVLTKTDAGIAPVETRFKFQVYNHILLWILGWMLTWKK